MFWNTYKKYLLKLMIVLGSLVVLGMYRSYAEHYLGQAPATGDTILLDSVRLGVPGLLFGAFGLACYEWLRNVLQRTRAYIAVMRKTHKSFWQPAVVQTSPTKKP